MRLAQMLIVCESYLYSLQIRVQIWYNTSIKTAIKCDIRCKIKPCNCRLLLRMTYYAPVAKLAYAADSNSVFSGFNSRWSTIFEINSGGDFVNNISAVAIGMLIAAHREGDEEKFRLMSSSLPKPMSNREMTMPLTSSAATIRVIMASREKLFWMKQQNKLHTTRQAGMNLMFWGPVAPIAESQRQLPRKKHCSGC